MIQKKHSTVVTKVWLCLLALGLLVFLAACGGGGTTGSASTPTAAPTTAPTTVPTTAPTDTPTTAPASTPTTAPSGNGSSITIANFAFSPASLTVKVGTKVTWTNNDSATHTVTDDQGAFNQTLSSGQSYSFTFTKAGTYSYHCSIHPSMTASIVVQ